jgi:hypothetical protein
VQHPMPVVVHCLKCPRSVEYADLEGLHEVVVLAVRGAATTEDLDDA